MKEEKVVIEDLILAAHNNAKSELKAKTSEEISKSTSEFGMHLDSLSDFVVFGAVPAFAIYLWMDKPQDNIFWIVIVLYVICSALRLARFNSELSERPSYAKNYFTGVPTPAAAFLMLFPICR